MAAPVSVAVGRAVRSSSQAFGRWLHLLLLSKGVATVKAAAEVPKTLVRPSCFHHWSQSL